VAEQQLLTSSSEPGPPAGGTNVTASLTQPLMADKLMWSPSTPTAIKQEAGMVNGGGVVVQWKVKEVWVGEMQQLPSGVF